MVRRAIPSELLKLGSKYGGGLRGLLPVVSLSDRTGLWHTPRGRKRFTTAEIYSLLRRNLSKVSARVVARVVYELEWRIRDLEGHREDWRGHEPEDPATARSQEHRAALKQLVRQHAEMIRGISEEIALEESFLRVTREVHTERVGAKNGHPVSTI